MQNYFIIYLKILTDSIKKFSLNTFGPKKSSRIIAAEQENLSQFVNEE